MPDSSKGASTASSSLSTTSLANLWMVSWMATNRSSGANAISAPSAKAPPASCAAGAAFLASASMSSKKRGVPS